MKAREKGSSDRLSVHQSAQKPRPSQLSDNLTEQLVQVEIDRQFAALSDNVRLFLRRADIMSYALNRLPAFYATTNRGRQRQVEQAYDRLYPQMETAVRQAIAAVLHDPLKTSNDLWQPQDQTKAAQVLLELNNLLQTDCGWEDLTMVVKYRLLQAARGEFYVNSVEFMDWEHYPLHQK
ncbi:MAG: competence protein ComFB [Leptolyngbya sp.]|nr:MAG: competence protein ComFB [Leptolyngbya sp.]